MEKVLAVFGILFIFTMPFVLISVAIGNIVAMNISATILGLETLFIFIVVLIDMWKE